MAEPLFRLLEIVVPPVVAANGTKISYRGLENIPASGGALLTLNHTSYVDWLPASLAARERRRRLRFMIKAEMQEVPAVNYVIRHVKLIPVDRAHGADAYTEAVHRLRQGELVGLHPEATISRSLELRPFKTGAARMALAAQVPIIPVIVWGAQRIWPKDHPKQLFLNNIPISVEVGDPLHVHGDPDVTTAALRDRMRSMLYRIQQEYPHPTGAHWVPNRLGGGAPTREQSAALRQAELAERARRRAAASRRHQHR